MFGESLGCSNTLCWGSSALPALPPSLPLEPLTSEGRGSAGGTPPGAEVWGGGAGLTPAVHPLHPAALRSPPARRPRLPAAAFVPPASCQAGVRALNAGKGPADGYHRWSVEIGPIGLSHRPFLRTQQKPPNKSTKIPKITKRKCHLSFAVGLCGGGGPTALPLLHPSKHGEVTRLAWACMAVGSGGHRRPLLPRGATGPTEQIPH